MTVQFPPPDVPRVAKLRVEDFMLLNDSGAFDEYAKTELIEGEIICMNAQYTRHARAKTRFVERLNVALRALTSPYEALVEVAVRLSSDSMPEPDIVIGDFAASGPILLEHVALIVEVSDSTVELDLGRKARIYAGAGLGEYWVLDVENGRLVVHLDPSGGSYRSRTEFPLGIEARSATIEGLKASTANLVD